jgi:exopolysaccharide biosynthesis polyprenyl glycosylphosphotransferase
MSGKNRKSLYISLLFLVSDVVFMEISFLFSYWLRFLSPFYDCFNNIQAHTPFAPYFFGSLIIIPIWLIFLNSKGLYTQGRVQSVSEYLIPVIKSITLGMFVVLSVAFFYRNFSYSRAVFVILYFFSIIFILFGRTIVFFYERHKFKKGLLLKNVLILGANEFAEKVYNSLRKNEIPGYYIIGYCADRKLDDKNYKYLGPFQDLNTILKENNIDTVVAVPSDETSVRLIDMLKGCEGHNIEFMYLPEVLGLITNKVRIKTIGGIPLIRLKEIPIGGLDYFKKRVFDVSFSLLFLLVTLPVSIVIAILIKLGSKGPLFYLQERVGLEGKVFKTIKFRSMRIDAETKSGPIWAQDGDNRTTRTGKFIRKYSIDEIPQFYNVLRGDMSVVGPRPERPFFVDKFKETIPGYLERHRVRTGITGWAQVNGLRGNTPLDERIKYDIYYVENWSLLFDIIIIFKTVKEVIFSKNAY